jgi:hypothetical protein
MHRAAGRLRCSAGGAGRRAPALRGLSCLRARSLGLDEGACRWFFQQIILALDYCHKMRISNRDIKLENTLLNANSPPMVKLCDFGYSINESHSLPKTAVGTPGYTGALLSFRRAFASLKCMHASVQLQADTDAGPCVAVRQQQ